MATDHMPTATVAGVPVSPRWSLRFVISTAVMVILSATVYGDVLSVLLTNILRREGSSHGFFIPFISGYLIWLKRHKLKQIEPGYSPLPGTLLLSIGFTIFLLSQNRSEVFLSALSFLLVSFGLFIMLFGIRLFKELSFPLILLGTMIPIPKPLYGQIADLLRTTTAGASVWLMQLIQVPIHRQGFQIHLPNIDLFVAHSCSGIRYLLSFFFFSLGYAYLCKKTVKSRALVVFTSIPIAVTAAVLRLSSIYLAVLFIGPFMAEPKPHMYISWFIFTAVLIAAVGMDQFITRNQVRRSLKSAN